MKNFKRLSLLATLATLAMSSANAYDFEVNGIYYNFITNKTNEVKVTSGNNISGNYSGDIVIPEKVTYNNVIYTVTIIANDALYGCPDLKNVTIGDSVKIIGDNAFMGCINMTNVTIGNSVAIIGYTAFANCSGLTSITIPKSVKSIDDMAFYSCDNLMKVYSPSWNPPVCESKVFEKTNASILYVPRGRVEEYILAEGWCVFKHVLEYDFPCAEGDVNGDDEVDISDANAVINVILGAEPASKYDGRADVNGDGAVDIADVNSVINIILGK